MLPQYVLKLFVALGVWTEAQLFWLYSDKAVNHVCCVLTRHVLWSCGTNMGQYNSSVIEPCLFVHLAHTDNAIGLGGKPLSQANSLQNIHRHIVIAGNCHEVMHAILNHSVHTPALRPI